MITIPQIEVELRELRERNQKLESSLDAILGNINELREQLDIQRQPQVACAVGMDASPRSYR